MTDRRGVMMLVVERVESGSVREAECYQISVFNTEIPQADHTRSSTQLQLSHYNEWE